MAEVDTILVKDANGAIREVPTLLSLEQMVASQATVAAILAKLSADPATQTTLAAILAKIIAAPATEAKQDTLIAKDFATQTTLAAVLAKIIAAPATEAKQDALATLAGALVEAAPGTDTASSGLNGRLQRIAQRLTSLIALVPASLGSKADAASLAVTKSTEDKALTGALTEAAPGTDTASSGLNGRLQRIAQRLTSLIALVPAALGQGTMAQSLRVVLPSDQSAIPVSGNTTYIDVTLSLDTSQYAIGDVLADTQVVANAMRVNDGTGVLQSVTVIDQDDQKAAFYIYLLSANVAMGSENSAPSISDTNALQILGPPIAIAVADYFDLGGVSVAGKDGIAKIVKPAAGTRDLYVAVVNGSGAPTYTAAGIKLRLGFLLD